MSRKVTVHGTLLGFCWFLFEFAISRLNFKFSFIKNIEEIDLCLICLYFFSVGLTQDDYRKWVVLVDTHNSRFYGLGFGVCV